MKKEIQMKKRYALVSRTAPKLAGLMLFLIAAIAAQCLADVGLARHKKLYAVPVPGKVTIDGKLDEWDLSGQIQM